MKRFQQFANSPAVLADAERLFTLIVLNCASRNGDAHLKNFGIVYDDVLGEVRLAPIYDLVTTSIYLPKDSLALTLNGTTQQSSPSARRNSDDGHTRKNSRDPGAYLGRPFANRNRRSVIHQEHPAFKEVGERMLQEWAKGRQLSLQTDWPRTQSR